MKNLENVMDEIAIEHGFKDYYDALRNSHYFVMQIATRYAYLASEEQRQICFNSALDKIDKGRVITLEDISESPLVNLR